MSNFRLLFYFLILIFSLILTTESVTAADNKSPQSQPELFDFDGIQEPTRVSTFDTNSYGNKRPTDTDHFNVSAINTSVQLCKKIGGEKGAATCSYVLIDRPWRHWRQKLSQSFHSTKARYVPIIHNSIVNAVNYAYIDGPQALQNKVHEWWKFPSLEWYRVKSSLISLWDQCYYDYLNWYSGKKKTFNEMIQHFYSGGNKNDKKDKLYYFNNHNGIRGNNGDQLEPDVDGYYYDVFGTTLCVDEQHLLDDDNGLNNRVNELFEAMAYDERIYTLRFQQRFIHWPARTYSLTEEAMDCAQSLWLQHTQSVYRFLDGALYLDPNSNSSNSSNNSDSNSNNGTNCINWINSTNSTNRTNSINNITSSHDQGATSTTQATNQTAYETNVRPPVILPFPIPPFATSFQPTFFSLDDQPQCLQSTAPPAQSYLPLIPIRRPWTACLCSQNDRPGDKSDEAASDTGTEHGSQHQQRQQNQQQHQPQEHGDQGDVDCDAQCQRLGYYFKNYNMDDDISSPLSTITSSNTPKVPFSGHHAHNPAASRTVTFIGQQADWNRQYRSNWVSVQRIKLKAVVTSGQVTMLWMFLIFP